MLAGIAVRVKLKAKIFPNPNRKAGLLLETLNLLQVKITQRGTVATFMWKNFDAKQQ